MRKDFIDTAKGIERRDDKIFEAPKVTRQLRSLLLQRDDEEEHVTRDTVFTSGETVQDKIQKRQMGKLHCKMLEIFQTFLAFYMEGRI